MSDEADHRRAGFLASTRVLPLPSWGAMGGRPGPCLLELARQPSGSTVVSD